MIKPLITTHDLELIFETLLRTDLEEGDPTDNLLAKIDDSGYKPLYAIPEGYALVPIDPTFEEIEKINLAASEHGIFRPQHGDVNSMLKLMGIAFGEAGGVA